MTTAAELDIIFRARFDEAAREMDAVRREVENLRRRADTEISATERRFRDLSRTIEDTSKTATAAMALMTGATAVMALSAAGDYEAAMGRIRDAAQATAQQMRTLDYAARELGRGNLGVTAREAAAGIEILARNGVGVTDILNGALTSSVTLSRAMGVDLADAADLATDAMSIFRARAADLPGIADQLAGASVASKFGFEDLRQAIANAGGVAATAGMSFEELNAGIAAVSSQFASGADAGTSFKTLLTSLSGSSTEAKREMERLGLTFYDAAGNLKPLREIAEQLRVSMSNLSEQARITSLKTIFGEDAIRAAAALADQGAAGIDRLTESIGRISATEFATNRMEGFNGALMALRAAWEDLLITMAQGGGLQAATAAIERLTGAIKYMAENFADIAPWVERFAAVLAAVLIAHGLRPLIAFATAAAAALIGLATGAGVAAGAARTLGLALGAMGGPLGIVLTLAGITFLEFSRGARDSASAMGRLDSAISGAERAMSDAQRISRDLEQAKDDLAAASRRLSEAVGQEGEAARATAAQEIAAIESRIRKHRELHAVALRDVQLRAIEARQAAAQVRDNAVTLGRQQMGREAMGTPLPAGVDPQDEWRYRDAQIAAIDAIAPEEIMRRMGETATATSDAIAAALRGIEEEANLTAEQIATRLNAASTSADRAAASAYDAAVLAEVKAKEAQEIAEATRQIVDGTYVGSLPSAQAPNSPAASAPTTSIPALTADIQALIDTSGAAEIRIAAIQRKIDDLRGALAAAPEGEKPRMLAAIQAYEEQIAKIQEGPRAASASDPLASLRRDLALTGAEVERLEGLYARFSETIGAQAPEVSALEQARRDAEEAQRIAAARARAPEGGADLAEALERQRIRADALRESLGGLAAAETQATADAERMTEATETLRRARDDLAQGLADQIRLQAALSSGGQAAHDAELRAIRARDEARRISEQAEAAGLAVNVEALEADIRARDDAAEATERLRERLEAEAATRERLAEITERSAAAIAREAAGRMSLGAASTLEELEAQVRARDEALRALERTAAAEAARKSLGEAATGAQIAQAEAAALAEWDAEEAIRAQNEALADRRTALQEEARIRESIAAANLRAARASDAAGAAQGFNPASAQSVEALDAMVKAMDAATREAERRAQIEDAIAEKGAAEAAALRAALEREHELADLREGQAEALQTRREQIEAEARAVEALAELERGRVRAEARAGVAPFTPEDLQGVQSLEQLEQIRAAREEALKQLEREFELRDKLAALPKGADLEAAQADIEATWAAVDAQEAMNDAMDARRDQLQAQQEWSSRLISDLQAAAFEGKKLSEVLRGVLSRLLEIGAQNLIAGDGLFGGGGGFLGLSGGKAAAKGGASSIFSSIAGLFGFADGGVMAANGPRSLPFNAYSRGGVATSPQLALFGEGRTPEAYVPLPDGRTIPVTLRGGQSGGERNTTNNVTINQGPISVTGGPNATPQDILRLLKPELDRRDAETRRAAVGDVRRGHKNSYAFFGGGV